MTPTCSIVIVNWNVKELVVKTITAVLAQTDVDCEIIVVDNASTDGSVSALKEIFADKIKLIASDKNLGFAKANNLAVSQATGEYLLILNPDCYLHDQALATGINEMSQLNAGILGFRLFNADGSQQLSIRNFPNVLDIFLFIFRLNHWPKVFSYFSNYFQLNFDYNKTQPVEQVMGACFLIKRDLFNRLHGFDERFYIWFEEVDLCKRVNNLTQTIFYSTNACATHVGGQSFSQAKGCRKSKIFFTSLYYYSKKHFNLFWQPFIFIGCKLSSLLGCLVNLWK